jgi:hypothetical protein
MSTDQKDGVMPETERLTNSSEIFVLNATGQSVDVYVNYEGNASTSDPKPLVGEFVNADELVPTVFVVEGTTARPYGAYTFSIRAKGNPDGAVLASASVVLERGRSFSAAFHPRPAGGFQLSIYENDLSDASEARLTVRHTGKPQQVTWELHPNGDPRNPPDHRSGSLAHSEWQAARNVVDNSYLIEFFVDGERVARFDDLRLAVGKNIIVYLLGDPQPTGDEQLLRRPVAYQELEFDPGASAETVTTPPAPPLSSSDTNAPIEFTCDAVEVWQTSTTTAIVSAIDPDGMVTNLSIDRVDPPVGGFDILGGAVTPSSAIGEPATAEVTVKSGVPAGTFQVWIVANRGGLGHQATCALAVTMKPITIARLQSVVDQYHASGDIQAAFADTLRASLDRAQQHLNAAATDQACAELKDFLGLLGSEKGKAITDAAHDHLERETKAIRSDLGCG